MLRKIFPKIVLALLLTGMVMVKFNIWPPSNSQQSPLLKTDKNRYELGENVTITLTNIAGQPLPITQERPWKICTSEKELVYPEGPKKFWTLEPGASRDWVWDQHYWDSRKAEPGEYVISDTQDWGRSWPFTIVTNITVHPSEKIQEAIDASTDGGIIHVRSGTYRETIIIDKPLTIVGENKENTTIYGLDIPIGHVVRILSSDVSLYNLTIKHPDATPHHAITIGSETSSRLVKNINISGNRIINCEDGIFIWSASDINIESNEFERNWVNGIHSTQTSGIRIRISNNTMHLEDFGEWENSVGICVTGSKDSTFSYNNITNIHTGIYTYGDNGSTYVHNELCQCSTGMSIRDGHNNLIGYNQMYENDLCISFDSSSNNNVTGNKIFENPNGTGIWIRYKGNNIVVRNTISNTKSGIHFVDSTNNSVVDNYVYSCGQACVLEGEGARTNIIEANVIQACSCGISAGNFSTDNAICGNDFFDNGVCTLENGTNRWECNYYSDYDGRGDTPYGEDQSPSIVPRNPIPIYWKQERFDCIINGSMTVSEFHLNSNKTISFNVNGQGYVNLTIPIDLLRGSFQVSASNNQIPHLTSWRDGETVSICFNHSTSSVHNVKIEAQFRQAGDINDDDKVNILDIALVAKYFGQEFQDE